MTKGYVPLPEVAGYKAFVQLSEKLGSRAPVVIISGEQLPEWMATVPLSSVDTRCYSR